MLIVGLGLGAFRRTCRHSLGVALVEELALTHRAEWTLHLSLGAYTAAVQLSSGRHCTLVWPLLPYNLIGWVVSRASRWHGIESSRVLVVHDELELAVGAMRFRTCGSARGNNGLRSVASWLGTDAFGRLGAGVGRPPTRDRADVISYVLGELPAADRAAIVRTMALGGVWNHVVPPDASVAAAPRKWECASGRGPPLVS